MRIRGGIDDGCAYRRCLGIFATGNGLRSMPGSVRGTSSRPAQDVVVRIVARKLADGRVEFGLRKVLSDGTLSGNLLPRSRMFPTTAAVGSWLPSTPISVITTQPSSTTTTPRTRYTSVDAGIAHACGLRTDQAITCWGNNDDGQSAAPSGQFSAVDAGWHHSCGLGTNGTVTCNRRQRHPPVRCAHRRHHCLLGPGARGRATQRRAVHEQLTPSTSTHSEYSQVNLGHGD